MKPQHFRFDASPDIDKEEGGILDPALLVIFYRRFPPYRQIGQQRRHPSSPDVDHDNEGYERESCEDQAGNGPDATRIPLNPQNSKSD